MYLRRHKYCQNIKKVPHKYACDTFRGVYCSRIPPPLGGGKISKDAMIGEEKSKEGKWGEGEKSQSKKIWKGKPSKMKKREEKHEK